MMSDYAQAAESTSHPIKFSLGTGLQLLSPILSQCLETNHELIIVTCFWAKSKSRRDVSSLLRKLSAKALAQKRKIRVRLCMSSVSIIQKLLQTSSPNGMVYLPSKWTNIGLPGPKELQGLEMVVKSVVIKPFSVMHPKFIMIDRRKVFMPSCNVSWENWFEGCIEMEGEIVGNLFDFWTGFWGCGGSELPKNLTGWAPVSLPARYSLYLYELNLANTFRTPTGLSLSSPLPSSPSSPLATPDQSLLGSATFTGLLNPIPRTLLLPSEHHRNPHFYTFTSHISPPPPTALNTFTLDIINAAKSSIYIQTPNLTCRPLIAAVLAALLDRGINVHIITSRSLMILEQFVTAGTITTFEIWKLRRRYHHALKRFHKRRKQDPELGAVQPGKLEVGYFKAKEGAAEGEPVKSHLKLTIVDAEIVLLGSGNMDRASWYTSQELGVAFFSKEMARDIKACVEEGLDGRIESVECG
jgi:phosphatidylserine/phosphatidylglycerophosphate/cardiolipin synthase-like enzyme